MILALTGAIGCGKSTAAKIFARHSWQIFDADSLCHQLYADPASPLVAALVRLWGEKILTNGGRIDRKAVAEKVFRDPEELKKLTALLHPLLFEQLEKELRPFREQGGNVLCEVPLLFETGRKELFDRTASLWCSQEIRHRRLREKRGFTEEEILRREALQLPADKKLELADFGFINNGSEQELASQIDTFLEEL